MLSKAHLDRDMYGHCVAQGGCRRGLDRPQNHVDRVFLSAGMALLVVAGHDDHWCRDMVPSSP